MGENEEKAVKQEEILASMELKEQDLDVDDGNPRASNSEGVGTRPEGQVVEEADCRGPRKVPLREYKKRKREALGDVDFEALMDASDQGQTRGEAEFEESPAVSVGLKEFTVSPIEEVRFKDFLKRRSRIQEYLECRNAILKLWADDPRRLLLVTDCGVSAEPSPNESSRVSLIREIHEFLDDHGYINIGVVKRMNAGASEQFQDQDLDQSEDVVPMEVDANSDKTSEAREGDAAAETEAVAPRKYGRGHSKRKHVVVVGAGPAGLIAASHLDRLNFEVTVFEARSRVGGRVFTDRSTFSVPVDLGASIITGTKSDAETRCDPSTLICKQLGLELTLIRADCPMYDSVTGQKVPADLDAAMEEHLNRLLDDTVALVAQSGDEALRMSLGEGLEQCLSKRNKRPDTVGNQESLESDHNQVSVADFAQAKLDELASNGDTLSEVFPETSVPVQASDDTAGLERRIMDWHFAHLEYGCAAPLDRVSLPYWNQDEKYGGFAGPHCMIRGGFGTLMEALAQGLNIQLEKAVTEISYTAKDVHSKNGKRKQVRIKTSDGEWCEADAVLLTVPLGCLKAQMIKFVPQLPPWKSGAITRLGFGVLNKVVMEFDTIFWDETQEIFGAAPESTESRGKCFMFWNLAKTVDAPVLIALVVGKAALAIEESGPAGLVSHAVSVLRRLFGDDRVPEPKKSTVTDWGSDQYSKGAYSYVAVGSSGEDYDTLGRPVENCLFFAGEATCKEHPDTVGGALVTGLKEAVRIADILEDRAYLMEEAESMPEEPEDDRNEVRDMEVRIAAAEYSNSLRAEGSNGDGDEEAISKSHLLKDMFRSAKTPAGRLFLAKEMALLPARTVKDFAGTKGGLTILNTWILDAMRKNRTQLLRLCIRLLLTVGTDILAVRLSGIGRTVKEKVRAHTSRDIRLLARQLVKVWIDLYHREKLVAKPQKKSSLRLLKDEDSAAASSAPTCSREHSQGNAESRHEQKSAATSSDGAGDLESGENEIEMSETVLAALRQAEAYQAAALAAAEAYASAGAQPLPSLPKILSFQKFAKLEKDVSVSKRWDFYQPGCDRPVSDHGAGSTVASPGMLYAETFDARPPEAPTHQETHQELPTISEAERLHTDAENKALAGMPDGHRSSSEQIKRAVSDYVAQLLTPLYKTRKLQKDAFKSIAKKATLKVMERDGARDSEISISEFMNYKRKNKIRALVDQLVEKHLAEMKRTGGS